MAKLLIEPSEIVETTPIGGDVDIDKYLFTIENTEIMTIEPLLGTELFDKIKEDNENDTLEGLYLTLYTDYVKPILKFKATSEYISICSYMIKNGGVFKNAPQNKEIPERKEIEMFAGKYDALAQMHIERFNKWILLNKLDEYKIDQDEVDAEDNLDTTAGWFFGDAQNNDKWY